MIETIKTMNDYLHGDGTESDCEVIVLNEDEEHALKECVGRLSAMLKERLLEDALR